jgi:hypothetical protein
MIEEWLYSNEKIKNAKKMIEEGRLNPNFTLETNQRRDPTTKRWMQKVGLISRPFGRILLLQNPG